MPNKLILPKDQKSWPLMERFDYSKVPTNLAIIAVPFHDIAHDMNNILPPGRNKDEVMRHLILARNKATRILFELHSQAKDEFDAGVPDGNSS